MRIIITIVNRFVACQKLGDMLLTLTNEFVAQVRYLCGTYQVNIIIIILISSSAFGLSIAITLLY